MKTPSKRNLNPAYEYTFLFLHQFFGAGDRNFKEEQFLKKIEENIFNKENFNHKLSDFDFSINEPETRDAFKILTKEKKDAKILITSLTKSYTDLKSNIEKFLRSTEWKKVDPQDKIFLLIGTHEIINGKKNKGAKIINNIIEIAKKYGDEGSAPFINGVLDHLFKAQK